MEHAANVRNQDSVGSNGKTAVERVRGRRIGKPMCDFGEKVLSMLVGAKKGPRLQRFREGIYVGSVGLDGRSIVAAT